MKLEIIQKAHELSNFLKVNSDQYFHSRTLATSEANLVLKNSVHPFRIYYGLRDLMFIGAITESPILLTGGTDLGKTTFAKLVMNSFFGQDWHRLDFDLDFGKDAYTNVNSDFFHESGKSLDDLYSLQDWMRLPGFIADELNGSHPKIARKALHIIKEKDITLPNGKREKIGYPLSNGGSYQFQIATINEGKDYVGTFDMDKALRRRTTIEIPMDSFTPTPYDRLCLQKTKKGEITFLNTGSRLQTILEILQSIKTIQLHPVAEMFIAYLEAFDFCKNSLTGEKGSIESRNGSIHHICTQPTQIRHGMGTLGDMGCHILKAFENDLCPYVTGITPGISENLITVAKGFALLRATKFVEMLAGYLDKQNEKVLGYSILESSKFELSLLDYTEQTEFSRNTIKMTVKKYINSLEVEHEDIMAAIGFVGYSKVGITSTWTNKYYQGNRFEAVRAFSREASKKFKDGIARPEFDGKLAIKTETELRDLNRYCEEENPWLWRVILPYLENDRHKEINGDNIRELYEI